MQPGDTHRAPVPTQYNTQGVFLQVILGATAKLRRNPTLLLPFIRLGGLSCVRLIPATNKRLRHSHHRIVALHKLSKLVAVAGAALGLEAYEASVHSTLPRNNQTCERPAEPF